MERLFLWVIKIYILGKKNRVYYIISWGKHECQNDISLIFLWRLFFASDATGNLNSGDFWQSPEFILLETCKPNFVSVLLALPWSLTSLKNIPHETTNEIGKTRKVFSNSNQYQTKHHEWSNEKHTYTNNEHTYISPTLRSIWAESDFIN